MQHHVGEQRERAVQLCRGRMQRDRALLPATRRVELHAEIGCLVGDLQCGAIRSAFREHRGYESRRAHLACRVALASRPDLKQHVDQWKLVLLDDDDLEPVREFSRRDRRHLQRRRRTECGWLRQVDRRRCRHDGDGNWRRRRRRDDARAGAGDQRTRGADGGDEASGGGACCLTHLAPPVTMSCRFPSGTTVSTTACCLRYVLATRWTSAAVTRS